MYVSNKHKPKPFSHLQTYLVEAKKVLRLLREVCVEFKELLVVVAMIIFFALGVYETLRRLFFEAHIEVQPVSRPTKIKSFPMEWWTDL